MPNDIILAVEFQRWWVLKSKIFSQESICLKDFFFKFRRWMTLKFVWKDSDNFWHKQSIFKVRFWYFSMNRNSSADFNFVSFEHGDSWAKLLLFRTHHLWNSITELGRTGKNNNIGRITLLSSKDVPVLPCWVLQTIICEKLFYEVLNLALL
jgi:hypothetical protein